MKNTGDDIQADNARWTFSGEVAAHFDQHIERSVPFYKAGHRLVCQVADYFLVNDSLCYELGCSTGALTRKLAKSNARKKVAIVAVDQELSMIERATKRLKKRNNVTLLHADVMDVAFEKADLIIAYYTMQFIKPKMRQVLFNRIYEALNWGGGFLLFEKVRAPDARFQDMMTGLYTEHKLEQGYAESEIIAKSRSLKGVLEPFSTQGNIDLMKRAGFVDIMIIMKYICFEGFLAIK